MKAIQLVGPGNLVLTELPSRALRKFELRIKVEASCVCGSDLKNSRHPVVVPQVPGHEFSGRVLEIGPECSSGKFERGDRVTAFPMMSCMRCPACDAWDYRECSSKQSLGFQLPGSFAEEVIVNERFAVPLTEELSYEQGALIEHLCCGYRLAKEILKERPERDSTIVIIGDGPIAAANVQSLRAFGFTNLTLLGKHTSRMKLAEALGARRTVESWETGDSSIDVCVYAAPAEETLRSVLADIRPGGLIFPQVSIKGANLHDLIRSSKVATGRAFAYHLSDFVSVMKLVGEGRLKTNNLVTTRLPLHKVPQSFSDFFNKSRHFKILITGN